MKISLDKIIDKVAGMGMPGLALVIALSIVGPAGGAAYTTALALLGGPFGIAGGFALLFLIGGISYWLAQVGTEKFVLLIFDKWRERGQSKDELQAQLEKYRKLMSKSLYLLVKDALNSY